MGCCESRLNKIDKHTTNKPIDKHNDEPNYKKVYVYGKKDTTPSVTNPKLTISEIPKISKQIVCVKKLNKGNDSEVYLLSNNTVLKRYPHTSDGMGQYNNEMEAYRILKGCHFVLDVLTKNVLNKSFTLPYIEGNHSKNKNTKDKVNKYLEIMKVQYGFERVKQISWKNVIVKDSDIYIIDFGSLPIVYNPGGKIKWKVHKYNSLY